jgi:glycosyltransferase involved in cell wall biosynthesis
MPAVREWVDPHGTPVRIFGGRMGPQWRPRVFAGKVVWSLLTQFFQYQIAYFLMPGLQVLAGVPIARLLGKRVVMKFSGSGEVSKLKNCKLGRLELLLLRRLAHRIMVLNSGMMEEAVDAGFGKAQLLWMPNPVDSGDFCPCGEGTRSDLRADLGLPGEAFVIVYVGRLSPEKELPSLVGAFARIARGHPEAILALVGDGPSRAVLAARVAELRLEGRVRFAGMVGAASVVKWLQASDVFALVSSLEGFPCSLIEAMATGLPSIVSDIPANTQLIEDGTHGLAVPLRNEESIAAGMLRLLGDRGLRTRLGMSARSLILENYSSEKVAERYEALFRELLH